MASIQVERKRRNAIFMNKNGTIERNEAMTLNLRLSSITSMLLAINMQVKTLWWLGMLCSYVIYVSMLTGDDNKGERERI